MTPAFDIKKTFVHLRDDGGAEKIPLTPAFWRGDAGKFNRVIGLFEFKSSRDLHASMQEMHPEGDEVLLLLSGSIDVVVETGGEEDSTALEAGQFAIVPRGAWHRLVMRKPGQLVFINSRIGMQSRPAKTSRDSRS
jgi:mannose-6-phosphate isomerase-like protein (cupin superfamily)